MSRDPVSRAAHRLLCGRLAGVLFLVGSLASLPVNRLLSPAVGDRTYAITALGAASAALCCALRGIASPSAGCTSSRRWAPPRWR